MEVERWRRVDQLLEKALDLPAGERSAFLDRECGEDRTLRCDVEAVLEAHDKAGNFLNEPAVALAAKQMAPDDRGNLAGRTLHHYHVISLIGVGGMGEVYRAVDPRLGREVAIKVLPPHSAHNPDALARFERETKAVAALSHPNILAIHDLGTDQGIHYAVMELLNGETLGSRLNGSLLPWREAVEIAAAIADGLTAAHARHIIHRDLKPENIFRTTDGRIKILDFGLARIKSSFTHSESSAAAPISGLTESWMVMGTVGYMSPEQVRGEEADAPSDIFSLGCVLYEMVTGKRAFSRPTRAETMASIVQGKQSDPGLLSRCAAPRLEQVIERCLQTQPEARYQTASDLLSDLNALLTTPPELPPANHGKGRNNWLRASAISAALIAILLVAYFGWRPKNRSPLRIERQRAVFAAPETYGAASFSPDCRMITFTKVVSGIPQVWVKNLSGGDPIQITFGQTGASRPRWSPGNDQIVFSAGPIGPNGAPVTQREQSIWSVPPLGGTSRKIIEEGGNANWSRDGSKLVFERGAQVWLADRDGTNQRRVDGISALGPLRDRMPSLSPDGSLVAYFQGEAGAALGDFWVIAATGGQPRRLTSDVAVGKSPTWSPDGRYLVFASQRAGSTTLWKIPAAGGTPEPLLLGAGEDTDPELCSDKLVYRHNRQSFTLAAVDPLTNQTRALRTAATEIAAPSFSPNGDRIAFFSHENDQTHLFTIQPNGSDLRQVTLAKGERNTMPQWSADGAFLYYYQAQPVMSLRRIAAAGGESVEVVHGWSWVTENSAQVDPAGKRIVYALTKENGERTTLIRDMASGKEVRLDMDLSSVRWSRDGKSILGFRRVPKQRDGDIFICPGNPGSCEKLTRGYNPRWSSDNSAIYFLRFNKSSDGGDLYRIDRTTRKESRLAELRPMFTTVHQYDVSPSGEIFYVQYQPGEQELWLADLKP